MRVRSYHRYWGKTAKQTLGGADAACHLLPYHNLDVAAAACTLLRTDPDRATRLAAILGLDTDALVDLFTYSVALHDIGKFARSFQSLARPAHCDLVPARPALPYVERHDALGMLAWKECVVPRAQEGAGIGVNDGSRLSLTVRRSLDLWMGGVFGHHGKPVMPRARVQASFLDEDLDALWAFAVDVAELIPPLWPWERLGDREWRDTVLAPATWELAGLALLADWLGSNERFFPFIAEPVPLDRYWRDRALPGAEAAVTAAGLRQRAIPRQFLGFRSTFGFEPTPLQRWAESITLPDGPQLFLLEDITGAGKTEAALTLVQRLLAAGHGEGLYFGLPTMATSNAMYRRLGAHYRRLYQDGSRPSLVLAHGARGLNEDFTRSILPEPPEPVPYSKADEGGGIECRAWLGDSRKKALLAEVGVGTVDQALLGILPRRHQSLRLLGLSRKVLVVDEVHAYDPYTSTLLERLLQAHAQRGGSAILLSATIPQALRQQLVNAWYEGRGIEARVIDHQVAFPLVTHVHDARGHEYPIEPRPESRKRVPVRFVTELDEALRTVVSAACEGRCVAWIRNTVDDAIDAFRHLQAQLPDPDQALLFHARFTMGDRQRIENEAMERFGRASTARQRCGRVLVATQVVEQSLDLDFDVLVSDLAPVDLLIQRAGRLHRHPRSADSEPIFEPGATDARPAPILHVLAPPWNADPDTDWVRRSLPGTAAVYRDASQLWHTMRILRALGGIHLPEHARDLLEGVYGPDVPTPPGLEDASLRSEGDRRAAASGARFNVLDLDRGYAADNGHWEEDVEIGTRLSQEPSMRVVLARISANGDLAPLHHGEREPWTMSTVQLRQRLVEGLNPLPEGAERAAEALCERVPGLRHVRFWIPDEGPRGGLQYDTKLGVVRPRAAGND